MTREDIIRMAHEARFYVKNDEAYSPSNQEDHELTEYLERFAYLVASAEREACAEICDGFYLSWIDIQGRYEFMGEGASECAGAIRARGQE